MAGIGIVVAILVTLVAVLIPWLPTSASEEMDRIEFVYWFATVICIAIFALVMAVIIYSVMRSASRPRTNRTARSIHGHTGLEIAWTIVPAILVIAIGVISAVRALAERQRRPEPADTSRCSPSSSPGASSTRTTWNSSPTSS